MTDHKDDVVETETVEPERFPMPVLASEAAKEAATKPAETLTAMLTCGDFGGMGTYKVKFVDEDTGEERTEVVTDTCDRPSSFGIKGAKYGITPGRCFQHTEAAQADKQRKKAEFLEIYCQNPEKGIEAASEVLGVPRLNVYRWADADPEFRANLDAIRLIADAIITDMVEEKVIQRILDPKSGADTLRMWFLQNRRGARWKSAGKTGDQSQQPFGGGVNITGGQHVWQIGSQRIEF